MSGKESSYIRPCSDGRTQRQAETHDLASLPELNHIDDVLEEADGTGNGSQDLNPCHLFQEPDKELGRTRESLEDPPGLFRVLGSRSNKRADRVVDNRRGEEGCRVEFVQVEADVEELVAEADEE